MSHCHQPSSSNVVAMNGNSNDVDNNVENYTLTEHFPDLEGSSNSDLYLNDLNIDAIPAQYLSPCGNIYTPLTVRRINLSRNTMLNVTGLAAFRHLVSLDVSNNSLATLSEEVGALQNLTTLIARNNLLEDLPKSLAQVESLEHIYLSGNRIEHFPESLLALKNLTKLHMGGNLLETLPFRIGELTQLEILYLGGNRLRDIPATIGRLSRLSSLTLCDNVLETIPSTLGELTNLETLSLHNNLLKTLPTEIVQLQHMRQLSLRGNPLVHHFVQNIQFEPPTLKELAGRLVRVKMIHLPVEEFIPRELIAYLASANQCVNPKCKGVYFEACVEHVKFVDFCGKYRVPLLQFLCSPNCSSSKPAFADENNKMRRVLLG